MTGGPLPPWATTKPQSGVPEPGSPNDRRFAAFIGPRWPTYRRKFVPFFEEPRFQPTWNWSAALVTMFGPFWYFYRRLYLPGFVFWMLPQAGLMFFWSGEKVGFQDLLTDTPVGRDFKLVLLGVQLSIMVLAGGTANYLLFRRARAAITLTEQRGESAERALAVLARVGRPNWIGVLVVLVFMLLASSSLVNAGGAIR